MNTTNTIMINIENEYKGLLSGIFHGGMEKEDRTGTGTRSVFGRTIKHDMALGFPLLTSKRISFNAARTELLWILQGRTDLKYLEDNGVNYWRPDYIRSGRTDETLGPVYGKQWRDFNGVDQLKELVYSINTNPSSRRLMVSAWAPHEMQDMVLPPCHYAFQVYINNDTLDLMWMQRSADVFLGLPYDIAMYGLLLELLAKGSELKPGKLIGQLGDCHLYNNHLDQAKIYLDRPKRALPKLHLEEGIRISKKMDDYESLIIPEKNQIKLTNYNPYEAIKAPLSVG
jgi:thymidylate synthase